MKLSKYSGLITAVIVIAGFCGVALSWTLWLGAGFSDNLLGVSIAFGIFLASVCSISYGFQKKFTWAFYCFAGILILFIGYVLVVYL